MAWQRFRRFGVACVHVSQSSLEVMVEPHRMIPFAMAEQTRTLVKMDPPPSHCLLVQRSNFSNWLDNALPKNNGETFHDSLQCYAIPFGGLGFLSECLVLYTIVCLLFGVQPLPWSLLHPTRFKFFAPAEKSWFNLILSIVSVLTCVPLAIFTMIRCRTRWELVLVAIFRMGVALTQACVSLNCVAMEGNLKEDKDAVVDWIKGDEYDSGIEVGLIAVSEDDQKALHQALPQDKKKKKKRSILTSVRRSLHIPILILSVITILILFFGCLFDTIAVISITVKAYKSGELKMTVGRQVALTLTRLVQFLAFYGWIFGFVTMLRGRKDGIISFGVGVFYLLVFSDWSIADAAHDLGGIPSSSATALYWIFFAVKRIPMLVQ